MSLNSTLDARLSQRKEEDLFRELKITSGLIDFCSNDYLGLSRSAELHKIISDQYQLLPVSNGATGSRLLSGNSEYAEGVELELAKIFNGDAALIFNSGYNANMAVLSSVPKKGDTILYDELAHACIKDGARLSHASRYSFRHNDLDDLEKKIRRAMGRIFIAVESVYSMDGDECPLRELSFLANKYNASIILDEAHTTGAYGAHGSGIATSLKIDGEIDIRIYTFGKAMGIHGACVVGSQKVRDYLINFARPFIYTTALPLHSLVSIRSAFRFLDDHIHFQDLLREKIKIYLRETANIAGKTKSNSAIQTIITPGNMNTKMVAHQLQSSGYDVRPILSPTVPEGKERLRICLHTYNSETEIVNLSLQLNKIKNSAIVNS
jgi:8-amino-7-oxononanoate synthase